MAAWLRREDDVLQVSGIPTWKALSEALKDVGQTGLAVKIQQKHQHGIHNNIGRGQRRHDSSQYRRQEREEWKWKG